MAGACAVAFSTFAIAGVAQAADSIVYNSNPTPGWIFGADNNSLNNTAVETDNGLELALRPHERFQPPATSVGNTYSFALGQDIGIDFSVYAPNFSSLGLTPNLTIFDVANNVTRSFNPGLIPDDTAIQGTNGFQNSEALAFSFMDGSYNKLQNNTFNVTLSATGDGQPHSLLVNIVQGSGAGAAAVPEPASWTMMILGFGAAGSLLRRRRMAAA
jgi:hypothetical protein